MKKVTIPTKDIIPVQTQRVRGFRVQEKAWLLNDEYGPLIVDQDKLSYRWTPSIRWN